MSRGITKERYWWRRGIFHRRYIDWWRGGKAHKRDTGGEEGYPIMETGGKDRYPARWRLAEVRDIP